MLKIVKSKSLIFIGARSTVLDENFKKLWTEVMGFTEKKEHYILCLREQIDEIQEHVADVIAADYGVIIIPIGYGDEHNDLWDFLRNWDGPN